MGAWGVWLSLAMLIVSNVFMTFAWFGHLRYDNEGFILKVILASWGIAFFEYLIMVPAIRIAHNYVTVSQIKIIQEAITLSVFLPFSIFYLKESFRWDYVWACLCILGAVFFIFREKITG